MHTIPATKDSLKDGANSALDDRLEDFFAAPTSATQSPSLGAHNAEASSTETPLLPLRDRDKQVLLELFNQEGIEAIEQDIICNLLIRCPEPCWEDDSLEFLRDYL
jgi:hypothetical protein